MSDDLQTLWAIGDLHGDPLCARHWVRRTGLVAGDLDGAPESWSWPDATAHLIFMGDYIDKGPQPRATLDFVRALTGAFPTRITALLGNHEVNLLHDRELPSGNRYLELPWAASHPRSYAEWLPAELRTENTTRAFALLQSALLQVYEQNLFRSVMVVTSGKRSVLRLVPAEHRAMVKAELARAQAAYLNAVSSGSVYGDWLEARPLTAVLADTLFVHGGVPASLAGAGGSLRTRADLAALNGAFSKSIRVGSGVAAPAEAHELVEYRGLHGNCGEVAAVRRAFNVSRIAVGHTPGDSVRVDCGGEFLALDSALGRHFRASGNNYCESELVSATAGYACPRVSDACEGQIVRFRRNGDEWAVDVVGSAPAADEMRVEL